MTERERQGGRRDEDCEDCLLRVVAAEWDAIVYVSDIATYELLYMNAYGKKHFGLDDIRGRKCYEAIQGLDAPCPFCTNRLLTRESFYVWEHSNAHTGRCYLLKDKLLNWNGRLVRLEFAVDITDKETLSQGTQRKLEIERTLLECLRILGYEEDFTQAADIILARIGTMHQADRAYIFEYAARENAPGEWWNTYEWCAPGIEAQKHLLQGIPDLGFSFWLESFQKQGEVIIPSLEAIRESRPEEYAALKPQGINSLIAIPLWLDGKFSGFIGLDNPARSWEDFSLLRSLAYFITNEQKKRNLENKLREMSYRDALTGLNNRNNYMLTLEELEKAPPSRLGVAFADLNGLKLINDRAGHAAGDDHLRAMSELFVRHFSRDEVFRIGGDEFVFLCPGISKTLFQEKIAALQAELDRSHPAGLSFGQAWAEGSLCVMDMVRQADKLMYQAKEEHHARRRTAGE